MSESNGDTLIIAIVGSRRRNTLRDRALVFELVELCKKRGWTVVSGACRDSADSFAKEACDALGVGIREFPVPKVKYKNKWEFTQAAFARNRVIAENCGACFALVHSDRTGGTENTISHCFDLGKTVYIVRDDGSVELETPKK